MKAGPRGFSRALPVSTGLASLVPSAKSSSALAIASLSCPKTIACCWCRSRRKAAACAMSYRALAGWLRRKPANSRAAAANAALKTFDWWNYTGAGHGWEYTSTGANDAARVDWRAKLVAYAVTLK